MDVIEAIAADAPAMVALRRELHAHPELAFEEHRTSETVAGLLSQWGLEVHRGLAKTGVVGVLRGARAGRTVGLRADMDALPITENNAFPHASRHPGRMHACGHDGHTVMLLAAARQLARDRSFAGTVVFIFQPAEEGAGGARKMLEDGLLERFPVDAVFGMHNWPGLSVGEFALAPGAVFGGMTDFRMVVRGQGAHAAMPHLGVDPLPIACRIVLGMQSTAAESPPAAGPSVVSTTLIHGGEATNAIADTCEIGGTVRYLQREDIDLLTRRMHTLATSTSAASGATCEVHFDRGYPPTVNDRAATSFVRAVLTDLVGAERVRDFEPTLGAEDFAYYLQQCPGCYFVIGNGDGAHRPDAAGKGPCLLHNASYDFNDDLIPLGATVWVKLAQRWLAKGP